MKLILVPTDFSEASENAIQYAMELNKRINAGVIFLHSYYVPVPTSEVSVVVADQSIKKIALKNVEDLKLKYEKLFPETIITTHVVEGFPDIEILAAESQLKADLLIMGTYGMNALKRFLIGSNTTSVIEKSSCPVITVPENAKFHQLNKIVFAANYGVDDFSNVFDLITFARPFNSEIILLHVSSGKSDKEFEYNQLGSFKKQLETESGYPNLSVKLMDEGNTFDGINSYLEEINADLFAISMRNSSFMQNVFRPSLTKKMVYHTNTPAMIFHTDV